MSWFFISYIAYNCATIVLAVIVTMHRLFMSIILCAASVMITHQCYKFPCSLCINSHHNSILSFRNYPQKRITLSNSMKIKIVHKSINWCSFECTRHVHCYMCFQANFRLSTVTCIHVCVLPPHAHNNSTLLVLFTALCCIFHRHWLESCSSLVMY